MRILIKNGTLVTMDPKKEKITHENIIIEDEKIVYIGKEETGEFDKIINAEGLVVMPGLVNAHTHLAMSIFRATNDNYSLDKWLNEYIWPTENKLNDDMVYYTTMLSLIEMIKTGTTCFNDMYFFEKGNLKAFNDIKVRGVYGRCLIGTSDEKGMSHFEALEKIVKENNNSLINLSVSPHALYTTDVEYLKKCEKLAKKHNLPIHIHLSENQKEVEDIKKQYSLLPVQVLDKLNFLNHKLILAHGTFLSDTEINLLKGHDVSICTNPVSNLNLGCGIANIKKYLDNNINVCLGTDGVGSGNNMNLFYHMSLLDNLQKGFHQDPKVMESYEVLKIATINGARALGLEDVIGSITVGKKADIIILDLNEIEMTPINNLIIHLVHNSFNNVVTTIINGNILMEDRKLKLDISIDEIQNNINKIIKEIM